MGQVSGKPLIIEFNGIPGSGKTTTAIEVRKCLRDMKIKEISSRKIVRYRAKWKDFISSKETRSVYIVFLKVYFLIRPMTWERLKFMNLTFNYWLGVKNAQSPKNRKSGICILDQGIIQGFVSMTYRGKIRNEKKFFQYIGQVMNRLDNILCINCDIDVDVSIERIRARRLSNNGRLEQLRNDYELKKILIEQNRQFSNIRECSLKSSMEINMNNNAVHNAERILSAVLRNC